LDSIDRLFEILVRGNLRAGLLAAALTIGLAVGVRIAFPFSGFPFVTFIPAVLITAFIGGWVPATLASAASLLFAWHFLLPAAHNFPTLFNPAYAVAFVSVVFSLEIGCLEVIRIAARRAVARRQRADELLAERDAMFGELQHRVANNMQFISSLLAMQGRRLPPGDVARDILRDAADRLRRFAAIHRQLHDSQAADRRFDTLAREVLSDLLQATGCGRIRLEVAADAAALPLDTLTTLILITTEAATNAIKHVFAKSRGTRLRVTLTRRAQGDFELVIADDGPGFPAGSVDGSAPAGFPAGSAPAGFPAGSAPAGFLAGSAPAGFLAGSAPAGFLAGSAPAGDTSLGFRIMGALVKGLHGTMRTTTAEGAVVTVAFPAPGNFAPGAEAAGQATPAPRLQRVQGA
jgi:two-component sensor histidine kinase